MTVPVFVSENAALASFSNVVTFTLDVGTGAGRYVTVLAGVYSGGQTTAPTSVTVGSDTLTAIGAEFTYGSTQKFRRYGGIVTGTGVLTVTANFSNNNSTVVAEALCYNTVDTTTPHSGDLNTVGTTGAHTLAPTSTTADLVVMQAYTGETGVTGAATSPATQRQDRDIGGTRGFGLDTPGTAGATTITGTRSPSNTSWAAVAFSLMGASAVPATATTLTGPSSGTVSVVSTNFTVGANGTITGTVIITPSDAANGGTFSPTTVSINTASPTGTFTYTPASTGVKTISTTNNGSLTNPTAISYTSNAAGGSAVGAAALIYQQMIGQSNV